ncbi:ferredoxin [Actinophytocola sp.]|uniref:ferredoxin n=1 Tax=Actinophytocola sp. TaxID=1872138 RepID=UPI002EDA08B5
MTWHVEVDERTCIGSGMCAALAPELFTLDDDHASPVAPDIEPDEVALDAADSCPALAITVTDGAKAVAPRS